MSMRAGLPYTYTSVFRVLGVTFDERLCFADHVAGVLRRVLIRQGVLAQLVHRTWRLAVAVIRSTHSALITSLIRYGLVVTG